MIYLEAPNQLDNYSKIELDRTIFLAGSITGAWNWQYNVTQKLKNHFNIFNPRRFAFDANQKGVEQEQISWEYIHLDLAEITVFYFSNETLAPISLFEYGKQLVKCHYAPFRKTYVCIHPLYARKNDILIQTKLANPRLMNKVFNDLNSMCRAIKKDFAV